MGLKSGLGPAQYAPYGPEALPVASGLNSKDRWRHEVW